MIMTSPAGVAAARRRTPGRTASKRRRQSAVSLSLLLSSSTSVRFLFVLFLTATSICSVFAQNENGACEICGEGKIVPPEFSSVVFEFSPGVQQIIDSQIDTNGEPITCRELWRWDQRGDFSGFCSFLDSFLFQDEITRYREECNCSDPPPPTPSPTASSSLRASDTVSTIPPSSPEYPICASFLGWGFFCIDGGCGLIRQFLGLCER